MYQCNCGREFDEPEARTMHMANCNVMKVCEERTRYRKALEEIAEWKDHVLGQIAIEALKS